MTVGAILLAAGSARRMGSDKLMADLGGRPVAAHVLATIAEAELPSPVIAISPGSGIGSIAGDAMLVDVADHALGMGHSLAAAIRAVPSSWIAAIICLGDMPFVRAATLRMLAASASADRIIRPVHEGKAGNPLAWGRDYFAELASLTGDRGGRAVLDRHAGRIVALPCDDPGILMDIDTPDDLAVARDSL